jgi:hypothetical protein
VVPDDGIELLGIGTGWDDGTDLGDIHILGGIQHDNDAAVLRCTDWAWAGRDVV